MKKIFGLLILLPLLLATSCSDSKDKEIFDDGLINSWRLEREDIIECEIEGDSEEIEKIKLVLEKETQNDVGTYLFLEKKGRASMTFEGLFVSMKFSGNNNILTFKGPTGKFSISYRLDGLNLFTEMDITQQCREMYNGFLVKINKIVVRQTFKKSAYTGNNGDGGYGYYQITD